MGHSLRWSILSGWELKLAQGMRMDTEPFCILRAMAGQCEENSVKLSTVGEIWGGTVIFTVMGGDLEVSPGRPVSNQIGKSQER
jgi:hypothetical protein